jgi:hypothetical protein
VLELLEELALLDLFHLDVGVRLALERGGRVADLALQVLVVDVYQVVVLGELVHVDFVREHALLAFGHVEHALLEHFQGCLGVIRAVAH